MKYHFKLSNILKKLDIQGLNDRCEAEINTEECNKTNKEHDILLRLLAAAKTPQSFIHIIHSSSLTESLA